jgi:hypothetical protein
MHANSSAPDPLDLASEGGAFMTGLSTVLIQVFPFALPLLILTFLPLAVLGLALALLALPIVLPLWLARLAFRALRRERKTPPVVPHHQGRLAQ